MSTYYRYRPASRCQFSTERNIKLAMVTLLLRRQSLLDIWDLSDAMNGIIEIKEFFDLEDAVALEV